VKDILDKQGLHNPLKCSDPGYRFFVSGNPHSFKEIASKMLRRHIEAYQVLL